MSLVARVGRWTAVAVLPPDDPSIKISQEAVYWSCWTRSAERSTAF